MYKILVADDNLYIREGVASRVLKAFDGIVHVDTAADGLSALNLALSSAPDILLTDLRMPFMDGLELAQKLSSFLPDLKIVFFSSYSDKEYLKAAIKLQAVNYLDKPVDDHELIDVVQTCISALAANTKKQQEIITYRDEFRNVILKLWGHALKTGNINVSTYQEHFSSLGLSGLLTSSYVSIIIRDRIEPADLSNTFHGSIQYIDASDCINDHGVGFIYSGNVNDLSHVNLSPLLSGICSRNNTVISVGEISSDYSQSCHSFETAQKAREDQFFSGNAVHFYENECAPTNITEDIFSVFKHDLNKGSAPADAVSCALDSLLRNKSENMAKHICTKIIPVLTEYSKEYHFDLHERQTVSAMTSLVNSAKSFSELSGLMSGWVSSLNNSIDNEHTLARRIIRYINNNYHEQNLSLSDIAAHMNYSSVYLSSLFKELTGTTIKQFITDVRISHVKQELLETDYSLEIIASRCGYQNARYLCHVFKKETGLTPASFREHN